MAVPVDKLKARHAAAIEDARQAAEREKQLAAKIRKQEKATLDAKAFVIGRTVMAEMEQDRTLTKTIMALLQKSVKLARERTLFGLSSTDGEVDAEPASASRGKTCRPADETPAAEPEPASA